ncbi:hypothetical protein K458DRAFT_287599, partial [Lentithecium fluviatile CBS 122367]
MRAIKEAEELEKRKKESEEKAKAEFERRVEEEVARRVSRETKSTDLERQLPIAFKDAVGRKYIFPYHLCNTWDGMEKLIKQAFADADSMIEYVHEGKYDLIDEDGGIILSSYWEHAIQP